MIKQALTKKKMVAVSWKLVRILQEGMELSGKKVRKASCRRWIEFIRMLMRVLGENSAGRRRGKSEIEKVEIVQVYI